LGAWGLEEVQQDRSPDRQIDQQISRSRD
jgi:hypothetical protein